MARSVSATSDAGDGAAAADPCPDQQENRLRRWCELDQAAREAARCRGTVLEIRYRAEPGVSQILASLLAQEQRACPDISWTLQYQDGQLVARIVADADHPEMVTPLAVFLGAVDDWPVDVARITDLDPTEHSGTIGIGS